MESIKRIETKKERVEGSGKNKRVEIVIKGVKYERMVIKRERVEEIRE